MMAAVIRQFVPSQRENRGFAHMPGGLRATGDDRDVRQMPDAADQGGDAQQPERREQQPDFGIVTHARLFSWVFCPITGWSRRTAPVIPYCHGNHSKRGIFTWRNILSWRPSSWAPPPAATPGASAPSPAAASAQGRAP